MSDSAAIDTDAFAEAYVSAIDGDGIEVANAYLLQHFAASKDSVPVKPREYEPFSEFQIGFGAPYDSHAIGQAMELVVGKINDRSEMGAYYTPRTIVDYINENTIPPAAIRKLTGGRGDGETDIEEWIADLHPRAAADFVERMDTVSVLDPACGSGNFLVRALDEVVKIRQQLRDRADLPQADWKVAARTSLHNIYGVDIMEEAVKLCRIRLQLRVIEHMPGEIATPIAAADPTPSEKSSSLAPNIKQGNSLIGMTEWPEELPPPEESFDGGGQA
jgi:type I restriction-modification system DNA methylase subunit